MQIHNCRPVMPTLYVIIYHHKPFGASKVSPSSLYNLFNRSFYSKLVDFNASNAIF